MILKYDLPESAARLIPETEQERLYYALPCDIDENGGWQEDAWFVVTKRHLYRIKDGVLTEKIAIADCSEVKAEAKIGGGILVLNHKGVTRHIVHYSAKHLSRYAYVARGIQILVSGRDEEVVSHEYEKICPKCHRAIPGTKYCPHCSKEGSFWRNFIGLCKPYKGQIVRITTFHPVAFVGHRDAFKSGGAEAPCGRRADKGERGDENSVSLPRDYVFPQYRYRDY